MPAATASPTRTASSYNPLALLQLVRDVALAAGGAPDEVMSTRAWDRARSRCPASQDAPAARRIAETLGVSWATVWRLAFIDGHGQGVALSSSQRDRKADAWLTHEHCDFALALIARRLGAETLTPSDYRIERARMLTTQARGGELRLPTENEIGVFYPSWDRALAHAGLRPRAGLGGQRSRVQPADVLDVLERCFAHYQVEPTALDLSSFARANGIPYPRLNKRWAEYVSEWKAERLQRGLPVPEGPPPKSQRPDYGQDVGAARPGERRAKHSWNDRDEVIAWVVRYLAQLQGTRPSQRDYNDWARQQEGAPWTKSFHRHGGWALLRKEAEARR